jgi:flagellum-specific peptidoglycan hydrolase FlgJ
MATHHHGHRTQVSHHKVRHHAQSPVHAKFIADASAPALQSEITTGVPASVTLAQAILESAWGQHHVGSANNYFGVKAQGGKNNVTYGDIATGYVTRLTKEHLKKQNKDVTTPDYFRSYDDMAGSFRDHGMFLRTNPRYKTALDGYAKTGDANAFAQGLQDAGYATDPNYAHLLISIMRTNNLYKYNAPLPAVGTPP